jgi:hypothetical protein
MVTAGVYLVVRSHAIFEAWRPPRSSPVVIVGTVTLLAGAWIGTSQDDIKKVLAGSTMSQIGYMMLAAGIGPAAYAFAIFHLHDARLLQGQHVPGCRLGHARHERRREHAPLRCAEDCVMRVTRTGRSSWATSRSSASRSCRRLLLQGPHHRGGLRRQRDHRHLRPGRRRRDGLLHDAPDAA